ncbi:hypothetical protein FB446DRAFT_760722 [Lentinula raphanica]|nr:hypothetical protein FB446DRAFT_760722 [Lentinula raphanica]
MILRACILAVLLLILELCRPYPKYPGSLLFFRSLRPCPCRLTPTCHSLELPVIQNCILHLAQGLSTFRLDLVQSK